MTGLQDNQPRLPVVATLAALTGAALCAGCLALVLTRVLKSGVPGIDVAVLGATGMVWLISIAGLLPVIAMGQRGAMAATVGYFIGAAVRFTVVIGACVLVLLTKVLPGDMFALTATGVYMPLLFIEAGIVGRYLWQMDDTSTAKPVGGVTEVNA